MISLEPIIKLCFKNQINFKKQRAPKPNFKGKK